MPAAPHLPEEIWSLIFHNVLDSIRFEGLGSGSLVVDEFADDDEVHALRKFLCLRKVCRRFEAHVWTVFLDRLKRNSSRALFGFLQMYPSFMIRVVLELALQHNFRQSCGLVAAVRSTADFMVANLAHDSHENLDVKRESYMRSLCGTALIHLTDSRMATKLRMMNKKLSFQEASLHRALPAAVYANDISLIKLLLEKGANVNHEDEYFGNALYTAVFLRHTEAASLLFDHGALVEHRDMLGKTALHVAAKQGFDDCVELILRRASSSVVDICDLERSTALIWAAKQRYHKAARLLLNLGKGDPFLLDFTRNASPQEVVSLKCYIARLLRIPRSQLGV
ncbi:hypothetical protein AJ79_10025 [Helicocarpus griseus UAMH5409]|uniref:Uncharacterized protein n=1 Tax=Helicocarpus griseus UAMH5409 TaxID=1447875 RepID=A0A2B7WFW7_9EURO|nr:hypothetical protein AJ79_10025 [Helicocarpus griseus UAMH5409]